MRASKRPEPNHRCSILLFGIPEFRLDNQPVAIVRRKSRALLFWIAGHAAPTPRDEVLACFWPDNDRASGQGVLRSTLYDLRKRLGPALLIEGETLALAPAAIVDARQFERGLSTTSHEPAALAAILELYRGDLLRGFSLPDSEPFEDWANAERERFRLLAIRGFSALAKLYASHRNYADALNACSRALALDSLQEDIQRETLRYQYLSGDRPGAIRRFEVLRKLLDDEMGVPPMPETRALYDAIITDTLAPQEPMPPLSTSLLVSPQHATSAPNSLPFVGRARELQLLGQVGGSKLAFVEGEPGIGKTRLVHEFITKHPQALVLHGAAHELEQGLPYQPLIEAVRSLTLRPDWLRIRSALELEPAWQAEIARLVPELALAASPREEDMPIGAEPRLWQALVRFILRLTQQQSVILVLDDLHWADVSTLGWLGYLLRHPFPSSLFVVATSRMVAPRSSLEILLQTLGRDERLLRIELAPLALDDVRALAEQIRPAQASVLAEWLNHNAEGNPFFVAELLRHATARDGVDRPALGELPPSIRNLIASRLDRMSTEARRVLELAAAVGREFDYALVLRATGLPEESVLDTLDELVRAGLIQPHSGGVFEFDHALTMQAVLQAMSEMRRKALHRRIAETLEQIHSSRLGPVAGSIARHWAEANAPARVAPHAWRAGQFAASVAAWTEAIAFFEQALAAESDAGQRTEISLALGYVRFNRGDLSQATEVLRSAIVLSQEQRNWVRLEHAHLFLNETLYAQGRYAEAIATAQELRKSCPPDLALVAEFTWGMALSLQSTRPVDAEYHLREAERLSIEPRGFDSRVTPEMLKYQLAGALGQQGKIQEALALYRQVLALVAENPNALDLQRHILLFNNLAYYSYLEGDSRAAQYARDGLVFARDKGSRTHQPYLLSTSGEIALAQNDLDGAENFFTEGLRLAEELVTPERIAGLTANLGLVARQRGDKESARTRLEDALTLAERLSASHLATRIRIWLAPLVPPETACQYLRAARAAAESSGYLSLLDEIGRLEGDLLTRG